MPAFGRRIGFKPTWVYKTLNQSCILTPAEGRQNVEYPSVSPLLHVEECFLFTTKLTVFFFFLQSF